MLNFRKMGGKSRMLQACHVHISCSAALGSHLYPILFLVNVSHVFEHHVLQTPKQHRLSSYFSDKVFIIGTSTTRCRYQCTSLYIFLFSTKNAARKSVKFVLLIIKLRFFATHEHLLQQLDDANCQGLS